jgi:Yip1-like protein
MSRPEDQIETAAPVYGAPPERREETAPEEPARIGPIGRLFGALFSPGETFQDVNRKPTFIVAMLIAIVLGLGFQQFVIWRVHPDQERIIRAAIKKQLERSGQTLSEEDIDKRVSVGKTISKFAPLFIVVGVPVVYLFFAAVFALGMILIQAKTSFKKILSVVSWSGVATGLVGTLVNIGALMVQDQQTLKDFDPSTSTGFAPTNLGSFLAAGSAPTLRALAGSIDIFTIWFLVLLSIGFAAIAGAKKITTGKTAKVVFGFWVLWILLKVGWSAITGQ